ncbi:MAG TPA: hypothetical protein VIF40_12945 [Methylosinus sp.]|jgi:hypothetical protein|uniref:hypothetical protein n=1 Tax=Methylosinus sp. TaxID=427 RepID=UPI002F94A49F
MNTKPDHTQLLDALAVSPVGAEIRQQIAARRLAERQRLVDEIVEAERAYLAELPELDEAITKSLARVRKAEQALLDAKETLRIANAARSGARAEYERAAFVNRCQLRDMASPLVEEFRRWISDEREKTRRRFSAQHFLEQTLLEQNIVRTASNSKGVNARQDALIAAYARCEALEFEPDDEVVKAEIERIRAELPEIEDAK